MSKIITNEIFLKEILDLVNPDLEILGEYIDSKTKIPCRCRQCGYEWSMLPGNMKKGRGCPKCGRIKCADKLISSAKDKQYPLILLIANEKNYEVLSDYINAKTKIKCKCKICGCEWESLPGNLLKKLGCPDCGRKTTGDKLRLPIEVIYQHLDKDIKILEYGKPTILLCSKCNYKWSYKNISSNYKDKIITCPHCSGLIISQKDFLERINKILPDIEILELYTKSINKIKCRCKKCNTEFYKDPHHLYRGLGCPKCSKSSGEIIVESILNENNIEYLDLYPIEIDKTIKSSGYTYIDFYLPKYNIFIEYNGIQHYLPVEPFGGEKTFIVQLKRDSFVRNYCTSNNIKLIEISYLEKLNNIEKLILSFINDQN